MFKNFAVAAVVIAALGGLGAGVATAADTGAGGVTIACRHCAGQ